MRVKENQTDGLSNNSQTSQTMLRAKLNAAKTFSPLLTALMRKPGVAGDAEAMREAIRDITGLHREVTEKVKAVLAPGDNHPAARATLAAPLAYLVGKAWEAADEKPNIDVLADAFLQTVELSDPLPDQAFDVTLPRYTDQALAEARAVSGALPLLLRIQKLGGSAKLFIGEQTTAQACELIREGLRERAQAVSNVLLHPDSDDKQANIVYRSIYKSLAQVCNQTLETDYLQMGRDFQNMDAGQKKEYLADLPNHPQGVLFERVFTHLDRDAIPSLFPDAKQSLQAENNTGMDPS